MYTGFTFHQLFNLRFFIFLKICPYKKKNPNFQLQHLLEVSFNLNHNLIHQFYHLKKYDYCLIIEFKTSKIATKNNIKHCLIKKHYKENFYMFIVPIFHLYCYTPKFIPHALKPIDTGNLGNGVVLYDIRCRDAILELDLTSSSP